MIVAALARERQVVRSVFALMTAWSHMFDRETLMRKRCRTLAKLTSAAGA
jgi:hypothetical protein